MQLLKPIKIKSGLRYKISMNILIYGAGAIGSHITYCLNHKSNNIALISKSKYLKNIKKNGINLKIFSNEKLKKKIIIKENNHIKFYSDLEEINKKFKDNIDIIFITVKLKDFSLGIIKKILAVTNNKTSIIPPCTHLPHWWFYGTFRSNLKNKKLLKQFKIFKKYQNYMIGMTMWVSAKIVKPGYVEVKHIQRGYPIKEIHKSRRKHALKLRHFFKKKCASPTVKNIYSEIYIKAINSFAFNLVALQTELNNEQLNKNKKALLSINKIFDEFDKIIIMLGLRIHQSKKSRIIQTLSSTKHTLSMLYDFQNKKKVEITYLWKTLVLLSNLTKQKIKYISQCLIKIFTE